MPNRIQDLDRRLSVGFSEATLARVNRLAIRHDHCYSAPAARYQGEIRGSACDWRQRVLRALIDEASRALEEAAQGLPPEEDAQLVRWFRLEVVPGVPRAHEANLADEQAVKELLAEVTADAEA